MSVVSHQLFGIFISRGGMPPGPPITLDDAKRSISQGQLRRDHPAWSRGMQDWKPLVEVIEYVEKKTAAHLPAISQQGTAQKPQVSAEQLADKEIVQGRKPIGLWKKPDSFVADEKGESASPKKKSREVQKTVITPIAEPPPLPASKRIIRLEKPSFVTPPQQGFEQQPASKLPLEAHPASTALPKLSGPPPTTSWPARKKKPGQVTVDEMGMFLWTFAKQLTREFRVVLEERFKETGIKLQEELDFNFSQELLVFHLWLVSKIIDNQPKAVESMNRKYVHRQSEIAQSYEHHWQQVEYIRSIKETFALRMETYQNAWNFHTPKAQTIAAACLLKNILGPSTSHTKAVENFLVTTINSYMSKLPRTIAAFVEQYEVV